MPARLPAGLVTGAELIGFGQKTFEKLPIQSSSAARPTLLFGGSPLLLCFGVEGNRGYSGTIIQRSGGVLRSLR